MRFLSKPLLAAATTVGVLLVGCSSGPGGGKTGAITVTPSSTEVRADGTSSLEISVKRQGSKDVTLRTARGKWKDSGKTSTVVAGGTGMAVLVTCDSSVEAGCAGANRVTAASEDDATGATTVAFIQVELCGNGGDDDGDGDADCADADCVGLACALPTGAVGTGICSNDGRCVCQSGTQEVCTDGADNNCDGKSDCADVTCASKICALASGGGGLCVDEVCKCPGTAEVCSNTIDDDCDGNADCADLDCQAVGGNLGQVCDAFGRTCTAAAGGAASTCTYCPGGQTAESVCNDGRDNDCDGLADCEDPDCGAKTCGTFGKVCDTLNKLCACGGNGAAAEASEATCGDGADNDCDGQSDCADTDCSANGGQVCGTFGKRCTTAGQCSCGATVEDCQTPGDDNCNGLMNCEEVSCRPTGSSPGKACDQSGNLCSQVAPGSGGALVSTCSSCSGNGGRVEAAEGQSGDLALTCGDQKDNDCDGTPEVPSTDCQDATCDGRLCSVTGKRCVLATKSCECPSGLATEAGACGDGLDNDCDGVADCADDDCVPSALNPAGSCGGGNGKFCTAARTCACTGPGAAAQPSGETTCDDGVDNDCDGLVDCDDPQCGTRTCAGNGRVCDSGSRACVCGGNGAAPQVAEATCNDSGRDNDCDGLADCADPDCGGLICAANGKTCDALAGVCACGGNGAVPEVAEATCNDSGRDNDCDGLADCADPDCLGVSCAGNGRVCNASRACACGGGGGLAQTSETVCNDGSDNDCDGLVDCLEAVCQPVGNGPGAVCDVNGNRCSVASAGVSTCSVCSVVGGTTQPGGETLCADGLDNDCDGKADCQDETCAGQLCTASGKVCASLVCACASGFATEPADRCGDGNDDDCDGLVDCADSDCRPFGPTPGAVCAANGFRCTSGGGCTCSGNGGVAQSPESTCSDGADNDCDGVADCADSNCRPVGNALGAVCDAQGNTCSNVPVAGGPATCSVCSGNGGVSQVAESSCGDGVDNDCDGTIDCQDTGCADLTCTSAGKQCSGTSLTCVCSSGLSTESGRCGDGQDNDCDGAFDCADTDCQGYACSGTGGACNAGACACTGNGGVAQAAESTCNDGRDNDCDGLVDCLDTTCRAASASVLGGDCSTGGRSGMKCDFLNACVCSGNDGIAEATESFCSDVYDNDCDGLVDCLDPDCAMRECSVTGKVCTSTTVGGCSCTGNGGVAEATESTCSDGYDNDCDGLVDCLDVNCANRQCRAAEANYQCSAAAPLVCRDIFASNVLTLAALPTRIAADGRATSTLTATLKTTAGVAVSGQTVSFAVTAGVNGTVSPLTAVTNGAGVATTAYTSTAAAGGVATITASASSVSATATVDQPSVGQVKFISQQYSLMGVRESSYNETNTLRFQVVDAEGSGYPAGLEVAFSHSPVADSYLGSVKNCTTVAPIVCTATGTTDPNGFVNVVLRSGRQASVVSVTAAATGGGASHSYTATNIAIVGAKASGRNLSLDCTPKNVPAFNAAGNCLVSTWPATINCTAYFGDRFDNILGVATLATLSTEAGNAGPPATTVTSGGGLGTATAYISVTGYGLPADVEPLPGEKSVTYPAGACTSTHHNPRDGLVTVIVSANGEEGFFDDDGDGQYDLGERFIDLPEPFVDANDNGLRDGNEQYVDSNNNFRWDGPNRVWDAFTVIWTETRVLYSGPAVVMPDGSNRDLMSRWYVSGSPPDPTSPPNLLSGGSPVQAPRELPTPTPATSVTVPVFLTDGNLNVLSSSTTYGVSVVGISGGTATAAWASTPNESDNIGMSFGRQYCLPDGSGGIIPGSCSTTCTGAPCVIQNSIGSFRLGTFGSITITGADTPGRSSVRATPNTGITSVVPITVDTVP